MRALLVLLLFFSIASASAQDTPDITAGTYASAADGTGDLRVLSADGRYEERHVHEVCRTGLAQRFGTWVREGDAIVVRFQRSVRIDGCAPEHRVTQRESSTVRWATSACTPEEAALGPCVRLAGRAWYRRSSVAADGAR